MPPALILVIAFLALGLCVLLGHWAISSAPSADERLVKSLLGTISCADVASATLAPQSMMLGRSSVVHVILTIEYIDCASFRRREDRGRCRVRLLDGPMTIAEWQGTPEDANWHAPFAAGLVWFDLPSDYHRPGALGHLAVEFTWIELPHGTSRARLWCWAVKAFDGDTGRNATSCPRRP